MMDIKQKELGIYIHIPFCVSKCKYCDFLSMPMEEYAHEKYIKALCKEIEFFANEYREKYIVKSVFFGGGTPSVLKCEFMKEIFDVLYSNFQFQQACEITVECNPGTVDSNKLMFYKRNGVNRLSFGLQSVNNDELMALGRIHSYGDFLSSYEMAVKAGFNNINVDLMSALPGQTVDSWKKTLKEIIRFKPAHISAYSLILEEGTPLYDMVNSGQINNLPVEDTEREIYRLTDEILTKYGYHRYEISNYSHNGMECEHNKIYWTGGEYAGFGLGAASLIGRKRYTNTRSFESYLENPLCDKEEETILTEQDSMAEFMYLGLRMMEGVSPSEFRIRFGRHITNVYGEVLRKYTEGGFIEYCDERIRLTEKGIDVSNVIFSDFL